jgi:hypothetical protein
MPYFGDIALGDTIDIKFCTVTTTGAPTTLAGSPAISAYLSNSTTQLTAGITLSVDFDSVTGLNNVRVVATGGNGYAAQTNYALIITTGTVGGTSVVGYEVGSFSIENRSGLRPTTAGRTLNVNSSGEADADMVKISTDATAANNLETAFDDTPGSVPWTGIIDQGTAQSATATTLQLRAAAAFADDEIIGSMIYIVSATTGAGQFATITDYVSSTDTATVDTWQTTPTGTITYKVIGVSKGPAIPIPVDVTKWNGTAVATPDTAGYPKITVKSGTGPGEVSLSNGLVRLSAVGVDDIFDEALSGHLTVGTFGQRASAIRTSTATAGAAGSITLDAGASALDDFYKNQIIQITGGTGANQARTISTYTGATKVATVTPNWVTTPDNTSIFDIIPMGAIAGATAPTAADNADAVWNATRAGHVAAGSFGEGVASVQGNVTGTVASVSGAVASVSGNVGGNVTGSVGSLATQAKADVNAEVVDCLNVDTYTEIGQESPAATQTIRKALMYLYKTWRNRSTQTATTYKLYADDAVTVHQKSTVSDDGTTYDSGEKTTGP